jgi:hypothetical protein
MSNRPAIRDEFDIPQAIFLATQVMQFVVSRGAAILPAISHSLEIARIAAETPALRRASDAEWPFHLGLSTNQNPCG